jgi:hypothetical protein
MAPIKVEERKFKTLKKHQMKNKKAVKVARKYQMLKFKSPCGNKKNVKFAKKYQIPNNKKIKVLPKKFFKNIRVKRMGLPKLVKPTEAKSGQKKLKLVTVVDKKIFKMHKRAKRDSESQEPKPKIVGIVGSKIFKFQNTETKGNSKLFFQIKKNIFVYYVIRKGKEKGSKTQLFDNPPSRRYSLKPKNKNN